MEVITLEEEENNVWLVHGHKYLKINLLWRRPTNRNFNLWSQSNTNQIVFLKYGKMAIETRFVLPWYNFTIFDEIFITGQWSFAQNTFNPINDFDF